MFLCGYRFIRACDSLHQTVWKKLAFAPVDFDRLNCNHSLMICTCTFKFLVQSLFLSISLNQCGMAVQSLYTPYHCVSIEQQLC